MFHLIRRICWFLLPLLAIGCQSNPTVVDQSAPFGMEPSTQLDLTFVNRWETATGPPALKEFGNAFLPEMVALASLHDVHVKTLYTSWGGFVSAYSRYYMQIGPVSSLGHRPGNLCIRVDLHKYDRTAKTAATIDKVIWSAWIWVPPLDTAELSSPSRGWGKESSKFLAHELNAQLKKIGFYAK